MPSTEKLEPGDRVLLYTDGVTEGRAADGTPFGIERLSDFIIRHSSAGLPLPRRCGASTAPSSTTSTAGCATTPPPSWWSGSPAAPAAT